MADGGSIRLKVTLQGINIVFVVTDPEQKVSQLMQDLAKEYESQIIPENSPTINVLEIRLDGFLLNPNSVIKTVLRDGDIISVIDYDTFITQSLASIDKQWFNITLDDFATKGQLWVQCGHVKTEKIAVTVGKVKGKTDRVVILDKGALIKQAEAKKLILEYKEDKWLVEIYTLSAGGAVNAIEAHVKPSQNTNPAIRKWEVNVGAKLTPGAEEKVQEATTDLSEIPAVVLPPPVKEGPTLVREPEPPAVALEKSLPSECSLEVEQIRPVHVEQTTGRGAGDAAMFYNVFFTNFKLVNRENKAIVIKDIKCSFLNKNNEWEKWDKVYTGTRAANAETYTCSDSPTFKMGVKDVNQNFAIRTDKVIKDKQFEKRFRAHRSFPQPLKIKYVFEEEEGTSTEIVVSQQNKALDFSTEEKIKSDAKIDTPTYFFTYADDPNYDYRIYALAYYKGADSLVLSTNTGTATTISKEQLTKQVFDAIAKKKVEAPVLAATNVLKEKDGVWVKTTLLVDLEHSRMKGLKVEAKTTTSHTVEHFAPPPFMLTETPAPAKK